MKLESTCNTSLKPDEEQAGLIALGCISELLAKTLEVQEDDVIVEYQFFLHNSDSGIETTELLRVLIDCEDITEAGQKREINISGIVANQRDQQLKFTLFYILWWDMAPIYSLRHDGRKSLGSKFLLEQPGNQTEQLSDSVFDLTQYRRDSSGKDTSLGKGRGFCCFGPKQSMQVRVASEPIQSD